MTKKERILRTLNFEKPDRIPLLGGFIADGPRYQAIANISKEVFWEDPAKYIAMAYHKLDVDGLILLRLPPPGKEGHNQYREVSEEDFFSHQGKFDSAEDVLKYVEALPSPQQTLKDFDADQWRKDFVADLKKMQQIVGDIVWMPTQWDVVHPSFELYNVFGYQNYMEFLGLYPDAADKFFGFEVEVKRCISSIVVDVYKELDMVPLIHIGTDICGKNGPVARPASLKKYFFPHVKRSLEPLHEAGFKTVWHSDGVIMPILDDLLECGISGFQGFQWEYGIKLEEIVKRRTKNGEKLIIFAGPSVTSTLPYGSVEDVRREIEYIIDTAAESCALFILPSNDVLPDVPVENLVELHRHAVNYSREIMAG